MRNRVCELFSIRYPIIQGGMVWCSGWELASAVSNAGGLGLIGSGSMEPEVLRYHIKKTKEATDKPFGVNVPLIYSHIEDIIRVIIEEKIKIIVTSAGNPLLYTRMLKENGIKVAHVVSNIKSAKKCEEAGVDAIICEGVEAGGHNGKEETTTMVLIPLIRENTSLPIIAAGGIFSGRSMLAAIALGADAVQIGSRFAVSKESSASIKYKERIIESNEGEAILAFRKISPVRMLKNKYAEEILNAENNGLSKDEILKIKGKNRTKFGIFDGDLDEGELEIGQVAALIKKIEIVEIIINEIITDYNNAIKSLQIINP